MSSKGSGFYSHCLLNCFKLIDLMDHKIVRRGQNGLNVIANLNSFGAEFSIVQHVIEHNSEIGTEFLLDLFFHQQYCFFSRL